MKRETEYIVYLKDSGTIVYSTASGLKKELKDRPEFKSHISWIEKRVWEDGFINERQTTDLTVEEFLTKDLRKV